MGVASEFFKLLARGAIYEKLIFNKEKENMFEEKSFHGIYFPKEVDTPQGRAAVRVGHELDKYGCFLAGAGRSLCGLVSCAGCIACSNLGDKKRKREVFKEYDLRYPVEGVMPELKPGMVVKAGPRACFLIASERKNDYILYRYTVRDNGDLLLGGAIPLTKGDLSFEAIYGDTVSGWLSPANLRGIYRGEDTHLVWKKPDPVKEMTVDEISKALGYKVKVVGSEKADD